MFEVNLVAIPAAVESKKQNHRATHHGGKQDRAGWERRRRVKELTSRSLVDARDAVAQHADETASIQTPHDSYQCNRSIRCDYSCCNLPAQRVKKSRDVSLVQR